MKKVNYLFIKVVFKMILVFTIGVSNSQTVYFYSTKDYYKTKVKIIDGVNEIGRVVSDNYLKYDVNGSSTGAFTFKPVLVSHIGKKQVFLKMNEKDIFFVKIDNGDLKCRRLFGNSCKWNVTEVSYQDIPMSLKDLVMNNHGKNFNQQNKPPLANVNKKQNYVNEKIASNSYVEIDENIPYNNLDKKHSYALIIGNEDYTSFQMDLSSEVNVDFANNDAIIFKEYCQKTLGVPERQIKILKNATKAQMSQGLSWIKNMVNIEGGNAEIIFYYSGHGLPDEITKQGYLMPVDVSGSYVNDGISLKRVYKDLSEYPSKKITVFLDACFSGGARNEGLIAMKGVKIKPKEETLASNMVVFASSSGNESSGVYREKHHGYFTYFFLKKLQETKGDITYKEMADYLNYNVKKETGLSGKIQTPQVNGSSSVATSWQNWTFR